MKIRVNTRRIEKLKPCQDRFENWKQLYPDWEGDITEFLRLGGITPQDKVWVAVKLMPRFLVEVFAIDCAMNAADAADAADADAADAADAATDAATYAADAVVYTYAAYAAYVADSAYAAAATAATAATYAAYAATPAATTYAAATAAAYAAYADAAAERQRQVAALIHLISTTTRKEIAMIGLSS